MDGWMVDGSKCLVNFMCVVLSLSFWLMPAFLLKKIVLGNFAKGPVDPKMADAIDFMVDRVSVCARLLLVQCCYHRIPYCSISFSKAEIFHFAKHGVLSG